jgi:catechol 2,3-dioxygenase-like lactoylglutathione lyase family enzyme
MKPRISIVTLGVSDLNRARQFYVEGLGLEPRSESVEGEVVFIDMGGTWLALWGRDAMAADADVELTTGVPAMNLAHNLPTRDGVDALMKQAEAAGATVVRPAQDTFYGGYAGYFKDPDGFLWEIAWNPGMPFLAT